MSDNIFQVSVRGRIPELDGKTAEEVLDIFCEKLGKPDEEENYWDPDKHEIVPIHDYIKKRWGLQRTFVRDYDYETADAHISIEELRDAEKLMRKLFPSIEAVFVSAYVFYNGSDEPIEL